MVCRVTETVPEKMPPLGVIVGVATVDALAEDVMASEKSSVDQKNVDAQLKRVVAKPRA